ncbi:sodium/pantothenate symporter [Thaumasiovibrio subtropicus]|uniref:sodium/pantothenate symporter n=1 Tax=Thaumasiovibrio subtropicus TaxID=1891207 RepID=UPI000B357B1B|nr:sodium/pantothenate symporter [Thaumasiovibrio subtropicus]
MNKAMLIPILFYLLAMFAIAIWSRRANQGSFLQEYLVGNRTMGGFMLAMTLAATYASASSFIGGPGAAYQFGLGWVLLAMIQLPAAWLTLGVLGKKFAIEARRHNALTINDMLYARFKHRGVVIFASLALLLAFMGTMVVQFVGAARLLQTVTGLDYLPSLALFAITVGLYTSIGGFRAVALTDSLQGIMMLIGTFALFAGVVIAGGGLGHLVTELHRIDPGLVSPYGPDNFISQPFILSFWVLVCFGVVGLPHAAFRCMTYRDSRAFHRGMVISTIVMAVLMLGMHLSGALGRAIIPDIATPDQIMPTLMITVLPPVIAGIFLAGPMAAIMSTIDSQLIQASATMIKDLYINYINPQAVNDERKLSRLSRWTTAIFACIVFVAATNPPQMIIWLNLLAIGALQTVFLWPLVLGLYWKQANAAGALCSMTVGLSSYILCSVLKPDFGGVHIVVPTLALGLVSFVVVSLMTQPKTEADFAR